MVSDQTAEHLIGLRGMLASLEKKLAGPARHDPIKRAELESDIQSFKRNIQMIEASSHKPVVTRDITPEEYIESRRSRQVNPNAKFPLSSLEVGSHFDATFGREEQSAQSCISKYKQRNPGWDYKSQRQLDGCRRFWRIA